MKRSGTLDEAKAVWQRLARHKGAIAGLVIITVVVAVAIFAPFIARYSISDTNTGPAFSPPNSRNLFGTDAIGRDIFSLVIMGSRVTLSIGVSVAIISTLFGALIGALAGYYGGIVDGILMRFTELIIVIPTFILAIVFLAFFGPTLPNAIFIISAVVWPGAARTLRTEFVRLKEMEFVESARAVGAGDRHIIFREILPNALGVLVVNITLVVGFAIVLAAGLSFLGLSDPDFPDWGFLLYRALPYVFQAWWIAFFPGIAISITSLAFNLVGEGLSQALSPKASA